MSQPNVDNLRAFWETWNTSDAPDLSLLDPDVTYEDTILPDHVGETYRGHEGVARAVARWFEPFSEITISLERIVGEGDCLVDCAASALNPQLREIDKKWLVRPGLAGAHQTATS